MLVLDPSGYSGRFEDHLGIENRYTEIGRQVIVVLVVRPERTLLSQDTQGVHMSPFAAHMDMVRDRHVGSVPEGLLEYVDVAFLQRNFETPGILIQAVRGISRIRHKKDEMAQGN